MTLEEFKEYIHSQDIIDILAEADYLSEDEIKNRKMLCVFHNENTPSLTFYEDSYYCFGCSAQGDAIKYIMDIEDCSFLKACQILADALGKELNFSYNPFMNHNRSSELKKTMKREWEQYLKNMDAAPQWVKDGAKIFYPLECGWDDKLRYYVFRFTSKTNETLGFTKRRGFELKDPKMKGRYPKWKHSLKDDSCVSLCNNVYNLGMAAKQIRVTKHANLVEGPKDTIPFILSNMKNVVACSGVSHMEKAIETLPDFESATLAFDDDPAGHKGRLSYANYLSQDLSLDNIFGYNLYGKDPYDYYQKYKELPEKKPIVELLTKEELRILFANTNAYNKELVIRELMRRDSLSYDQASTFFMAGKQKVQNNVKKEMERLEKEGDDVALRKLKIKYGIE